MRSAAPAQPAQPGGWIRQKAGELLRLVMHARARQWWRGYEDVFGKDSEFPGFENDAARISVYMPLVLPGLLQVPAYIQAHMQAGSQPSEWRVRAMEARLRRQQALARTDGTAPRLTAVITEASLAYSWGTPAQQRDQVKHLIATSGKPNVELRLLRFEDGPHPGMSSLINLFDFPGDEDPQHRLPRDRHRPAGDHQRRRGPRVHRHLRPDPPGGT